MQAEQAEWHWLDSGATVTLAELARCCGMSEAELRELVDYCALVPLTATAPEPAFSAHWVVPLRTAARLRLDFDLDLFTVALLLGQLSRIEALERELQSLQALLPPQRHSPANPS